MSRQSPKLIFKMGKFARLGLYVTAMIFIFVIHRPSFVQASYSPPPKPLSCMSYLETDHSFQDDYDSSSSGEDDYMLRERINKKHSYESANSNYLDISLTPIMKDNTNTAKATAMTPTTSTMTVSTVAPPQPRVCSPDYSFCFSIWRHTANGSQIEKQGCWKQNAERSETCNQRECTSSAPTAHNNSLYYCCCSGDLCNKRPVIKEPAVLQLSKDIQGSEKQNSLEGKGFQEQLFSSVGFIVMGVVIGSLAVYACNRFYRRKRDSEEAPLAPSGPGYSSNLRNVDNISLVSLLGSGKFGTVMKGILNDQEVAVKIFPEMHYHNYLNERNIYSLPMMNCPALLTYFGYDERDTIDGRREYLLVLSLAPLGCLQDYLVANALDFQMFCGMSRSVARGLSHLHSEMRYADEKKPCIVHRDLNTRNILVKSDHTCCIADFGFALKVSGSQYEYKGQIATAETRGINEVGTLRYMAPELLEGAVNLRDCESSLKQMDVYALALVLWELATRCADFYADKQAVPAYKAPFETEVGIRPTLDMMQTTVVVRRIRPIFPVGWGGGPATKLIQDTCEDCWDHDAEARLTAMCVEERTIEVANLRPRNAVQAQYTNNLVEVHRTLRQNQEHAQMSTANADRLEAALKTQTNDFKFTGEFSEPIILPPNQQIVPPVRTINAFSEGSDFPLKQKLPERNKVSHRHNFHADYQTKTASSSTDNCKHQAGHGNASTLYNKNFMETLSNHEDQPKQSQQNKYVEAKKVNNNETEKQLSNLPKQLNTGRRLRGWQNVRAVIQEKLFHPENMVGTETDRCGDVKGNDAFDHELPCSLDEKSNLVDYYSLSAMNNWGKNQSPNTKMNSAASASASTSTALAFKNELHIASKQTCNDPNKTNHKANNKRPNNLDLSPVSSNTKECHSNPQQIATPGLSNRSLSAIHTIAEEEFSEDADNNMNMRALRPQSQSQLPDLCRPSLFMPASISLPSTALNGNVFSNSHSENDNESVFSNYSNDNCSTAPTTKSELCLKSAMRKGSALEARDEQDDRVEGGSIYRKQAHVLPQNFKRQRSLEVFREVFSGRGSTEKLRDPSQRVKTPGDVPPSVRKVRASKTLSLYDDRMMDTTSLNIL